MFKRIPVSHREWALFGLRWMIPLGVLVLTLFDSSASLESKVAPMIVVGVAATVSNLLLALLLIYTYWSRSMTALTVALDVGLVGTAVFAIDARLVWLGLIPAAVTGFYFNWMPSLITGFVVAAATQIPQIAMSGQSTLDLPTLILTAVALPAVGPISALLSHDRTEEAALRDLLRSRGQRAEQVTRLANEYMRVVYEMVDVLSASQLDPKRVLSSAVEFGLEGLERVGVRPPLFAAILLFDNDEELGTVLRMARASASVMPSDYHVVVPGLASTIGKAISTLRPTIANAPTSDTELQQFQTFRTCKTVMCLPLSTGKEVSYGVMLVGSMEEDAFRDLHVELMRAVANQAAASLYNAKLYVSLREQRDRIIEVEKSARAQLASELHDGPTQSVAAITMRLNYIRRLIEKKPESAVSELYQIEEMARRTTKEIRALLFELRPKALEQGLGAGLEQLASKMKETYDQDVEVTVEDNCDQLLDGQTTLTLFSIATEAVNNARKHATAQLIRIRLTVRQNALVLEISDNGRGFDVEKALAEARQREGHLGLINLQERAALVEGDLTIQSVQGQGTTMVVAIPLEIVNLRKAEETHRQAETAASASSQAASSN